MKSKLYTTLITVLVITITSHVHAQNTFPSSGKVGIGTTTPNASSLLEVKSTTKGMLIPRMTEAQRNAIPSPATGLIIYQTNNNPGFFYYSGTGWLGLSSKISTWNVTGNANTNPSLNFIGTTDDVPLVFKVDGTKAGIIDDGTLSTALGYQALLSNTTGRSNVAIGDGALYSNTNDGGNTAIGTYTLAANTNADNTALGMSALESNTSGSDNIGAGVRALYYNNTGEYNSAFGNYSLYSNTSGYSNVAIGINALYSNKLNSNLVAVGDSALYRDTIGRYNTAVGSKALFLNAQGSYNTATGYNALYSNSNSESNTANGYQALYYNTGGFNTATGAFSLLHNTGGAENTADGSGALQYNTVGNKNTAIGSNALVTNIDGNDNTAVGTDALHSDTAGHNTAIGQQALYFNTSGTLNVATGEYSLYNNYSGFNNTANGNYALYSNTTGGYNVGQGTYALYSNTTGDENTAIGEEALYYTVLGSGLTSVGDFGDITGNFSNSSIFGARAVITASNQVRIGDNDVTSIGGYAGWSNVSDGRVKKNIKQNVPGLAFINKLQPITYNLDLDAADKIVQPHVQKDAKGNVIQKEQWQIDARQAKQQIVYTGFVAQDVEKAAKSLNYDFSGVDAAKNSKDLYGLRYAEFVVPLVKAVQELSRQNDSLKSTYGSQIDDLQNQINQLKAMIVSSAGSNQSTLVSSASLAQNIPNPFSSATTIGYNLPAAYSSANILVTDAKGVVLKQINLNSKGKGNVQLDASTLASGAYRYSLYVDGKMIDSKQMISSK